MKIYLVGRLSRKQLFDRKSYQKFIHFFTSSLLFEKSMTNKLKLKYASIIIKKGRGMHLTIKRYFNELSSKNLTRE